jgi:hypothetical protein
MSDRSLILSLPYIQPSQAQKHVTHNEALSQLDAIVQLAVISADLDTPPPLPEDGARYIVSANAIGAWTGQDTAIAVWLDNAWVFHTPLPGWRSDVLATGTVLRFDGSAWVQPATGALQNLPQVGVGTTADDTNRLSVAADATLLTNAGQGHQLKINKDATGDTASLLFQTGFSGRAEMGTAGNDDFSIKVSADGSTFNTAIAADASDGAVHLPQGKLYFDDVFILDDDVFSFDIPFSNPARILMWLAVNITGRYYLFSLTGTLAGAGNFGPMFINPPGSLNFLTGVLDGTTGPDDAINLSIDTSGPNTQMHIENRLGSNRFFTMSTLGK